MSFLFAFLPNELWIGVIVVILGLVVTWKKESQKLSSTTMKKRHLVPLDVSSAAHPTSQLNATVVIAATARKHQRQSGRYGLYDNDSNDEEEDERLVIHQQQQVHLGQDVPNSISSNRSIRRRHTPIVDRIGSTPSSSDTESFLVRPSSPGGLIGTLFSPPLMPNYSPYPTPLQRNHIGSPINIFSHGRSPDNRRITSPSDAMKSTFTTAQVGRVSSSESPHYPLHIQETDLLSSAMIVSSKSSRPSPSLSREHDGSNGKASSDAVRVAMDRRLGEIAAKV